MKKKNIKILVATHKKYEMPKDSVYLPIHVGAEGKKSLGYQKDNEGENISSKNANYCELTALYWAWKNLKCDIIGLAHYRRYFSLKSKDEIKKASSVYDIILSEKEINTLLEKYDIIVSQKKNLFLYTIRDNYKIQHYEKDLDITRDVILEFYPEYQEAFDVVMRQHKMSICNMFVTNKKIFDAYCEWLFTILFEVEKRVDISNYSVLQKRIFGFLSERLFNVWLEKNKDIQVGTLPIVSLEHDSLKVLIQKASRRILHIKS